MTLYDAEYALDLVIGRLFHNGQINQRSIHNSYSKSCAVNSATYYCYYYGWQSYNAQASLIGSDSNGFVYYDMSHSTLQGYYESVTLACYNGPSDNDSPAIQGNASQQFTVELHTNGSVETIPYSGDKYAIYTGVPVVACLSIDGSDYAVRAGIASEATVAAAQSACGMTNKTADISITIT